jgi:SAM-dependent methyltransferase
MASKASRAGPGAFEQGWRDRFERFGASQDDDAGIAGWSRSGLATRFRRFESLFTRSVAGQVWLDAGCGAGTYARFLAARGGDVLAFDYSVPTLLKARARSPGPIAWATADVTALPLRAACVNGALCFGVLQALSAPDAALAELARVVRPGGEVWVDALNANCVPSLLINIWRALRRRPRHLRYDSPSRVVALMHTLPFDEVRCHWVPILPSPLQRLQPIVETRLVRALLAAVPFIGSLVSHSFVVVGRVPVPGAPR